MSTETETTESAVRRAFHIGLLLKAVLSLIELACAFALLAIPGDEILRMTAALTIHELLQNPHDVVASFLMRTAESLSVDHKTAAALYLLSHGAIKLFLVIMILRGRTWAYPVFMAALALLIAYQSYRLTLGFSPWLAGLTLLDIVILWLTTHEYRYQRAHR